jgi:hypothetical protein
MKIENGELEWLAGFLLKTETNAKGARMRTKFVELLKSHFDNFQGIMQELVDMHSLKKDGKPKIEEHEGKHRVIMKDQLAFKQDVQDLYCESSFIQENEENEDMLRTIADIFYNSGVAVSGYDAIIHNKYWDRFEDLNYK